MDIYSEIAKRTNGNIYIGVVGPVRTGKSTFIKRVMEKLIMPSIEDEVMCQRARDELPQSAAGKMIMTTEPKFVPENAVEITLQDGVSFKTRLIDCVGYIVDSAEGYMDGAEPRLVNSPWSDDPIAFEKAAEIGTQKVIRDHATVGVVITSDGSISDLPREDYINAENRVIGELKKIGKPFVMILNSKNPDSGDTKKLQQYLQSRHQVPVFALNCFEIEKDHIDSILSGLLYRFPVKEVSVAMPGWINSLGRDHWLKSKIFDHIISVFSQLEQIDDVGKYTEKVAECEYIQGCRTALVDAATGSVKIEINLQDELLYKVIGESTGLELVSETDLLPMLSDLARCKKEYDKIRDALEEVEATGYGIVMPTIDELTLEEPEIVKQGNRYGVKLRASAPSIHLMKANITTEVSPIVGSEQQSEELIMYLLKEFEENPLKIWQSNIFGKSLHELVNEGLRNKLYRMPQDARAKIGETLERVINEGCSGLICIII